jgi:hypothetical protein
MHGRDRAAGQPRNDRSLWPCGECKEIFTDDQAELGTYYGEGGEGYRGWVP